MRTAFSHYISPALMEELASDPSRLKLGGEVRDMSVMFTDIRNFTALCETLSPQQSLQLLNQFLTAISEVVEQHEGVVDKYMGDGVMAIFGAPPTQDGYVLNLRLVCRSNVQPLYRSDVTYFERLHWQAMVDGSPEELAERARDRLRS